MPKSIALFVSSIILGFPVCLVADDSNNVSDKVLEQAGVIRDRALAESEAFNIVEQLTMQIGPRPAGSAADKAAVKWAETMLTSLGLSNVRSEPVTVPHWDRGLLTVRTLAPYPQLLTATSLGGSIGTAEEGLQAPVIGVEDIAALAALGSSEIAGKIVFIDKHMERHADGSGYEEAVAGRGCGAALTEARGGVATVIRSAGTSVHRVPHTGAMRPAGIPAVALSNADADILAYQLRQNTGISLSIHSSARTLPDELSANVMGEIIGSDKPDEIVLMGAHLDSWDLGTGAIDDGAGVAIVAAAAKAILDSGIRPRRTIRVVLFANEEFGLSGGRAYADKHADSVDKHVIGMEADYGAGAVLSFSSQVAESALPLVSAMQTVLQPLVIEFGNNKASGGADISALRAAGMPVLDLMQDGTFYFDYHHTPDDTLDKINPQDLNQNVAAYAVAAFISANTDQDFGRLEIKERGSWSCDSLEQ